MHDSEKIMKVGYHSKAVQEEKLIKSIFREGTHNIKRSNYIIWIKLKCKGKYPFGPWVLKNVCIWSLMS